MPAGSLLSTGASLFAARRYFEAHEVWEDAWRAARGPERALLQGLIQLAVGLLKLQQGKPRAARTLLTRALGHLWPLQPSLAGVDITRLVDEVQARLASLVDDAPFALGLPLTTPAELPPPRPQSRTSSAGAGVLARDAGCPYCGEQVEVLVEGTGAAHERYVEDCPVCCRPWQVEVERHEGGLTLRLGRQDD